MKRWPMPQRLGALALLLAFSGLAIDRPMFFAAWLSAWWFVLAIVMGALANTWLHAMTGGAWGLVLRPAAWLLARRLRWLLLLWLPLAFGMQALYPWAASGPALWTHAMARPAFVLWWLSPGFFALRLLGYAAVWCWLTRPAALQAMGSGRGARSMLANALVSALAGIDLLMSLMPAWYSSAFGMLVLISQMLAGASACVLLVAALTPQRLKTLTAGRAPLSRDLGNLLLCFVMVWAYIAFMQFLIIWAEDLPREIAWYLPRLQGGWGWMALALVLLHFVLPFCALLLRALKDVPARLAWLAGALLVAHLLDAAWLVLPSVAPHSAHGWWLTPLCAAGMLLLLFGDVPAALRAQTSQGAPVAEPADFADAAAAAAAAGEAHTRTQTPGLGHAAG